MLLAGALDRVARARVRMERRQDTEKRQLVLSAVQIVGELRSTLDIGNGSPFAANMDDVCEYMSRQLVAADFRNHVATLDEVSHLLREVRLAWVMLPPEARTARAEPAAE